jgi:universal stress protein E
MQLQRIVVAIKPWQRGLPLAAAHARQLAQSVGAELRLVSTVHNAGIAARGERGDKQAAAAREHTIAAARLELERLAQSLREWGATVTTQVVWGSPVYECVLAVVREWGADLLVVGVHEAAPAHVRLTDTDWELMRHVGCPLLIVKDPSFDGYATVLAAVDPLHAHAEPHGLDRAVLAAARAFTGAFASRLRVVNAYAGAAAYELASAVEVSPGVFYGSENVEAVHRRAVEELAEDFGVAGDAIDLVAGRPAEVIIDTAAEHDAALVVVGVPQRRGRLAAVVGSTAEIVAAELPCDVLVVPSPPPR